MGRYRLFYMRQDRKGVFMKKLSFVLAILALALVFGLALVSCGDDPGGGSTALDGTWRRGSSSYYYQIVISRSNWVASEGPASNMQEVNRGSWSTNSTIAFPSTGSVTLTVTHYKAGSNWASIPPEYAGRTNTASFSLNSAGDSLTLSNASLTTSGVWGSLQGTYRKQ